MKISVVTISKNQGNFIDRCIKSVIEQNYKNYEHIIIDSFSTDNTHKILDNLKNNKTKIIIENDLGPSDGLNKGFSLAGGDIFYFLNSDDYLLPETFSKISKEFIKNKKLKLLISPGYIVDDNEKILTKIFPSFPSAKRYVNGICQFFQQGIFFRSSLYYQSDKFNINNKTNWDGELYLNFLTKINSNDIKRINHYSAAFRIHNYSITKSVDNSTEYKKNQQRLFEQVYGNSKKKKLINIIFLLILQIISDPKWFLLKIYFKIKYRFKLT